VLADFSHPLYLHALIYTLQAAAEVSTSYRALVDLFKCFELYLNRLKVFTMVPKLPSAVEIY
jgi:hypothetical protein